MSYEDFCKHSDLTRILDEALAKGRPAPIALVEAAVREASIENERDGHGRPFARNEFRGIGHDQPAGDPRTVGSTAPRATVADSRDYGPGAAREDDPPFDGDTPGALRRTDHVELKRAPARQTA
jgi:hypothetical protein